MSERVLRVGLIGLGRHMTEVLAGALAADPAHEIVAVCDIDRQRIDGFARGYAAGTAFTDYRELFAHQKMDAVVVAVGHRQNFPILEAALRAGVDAFVEKTPVRSVAEADRLVELQRETGHWVMAGFNRRFMDSYLRVKEIADSAEFGGPHLYQSQFHATRYDEEAFKLNHIIHHLDLARFLLGEIELTQVQRVRVSELVIGYTISFVAESGAIGTIQAGSMLDARYPVERLELVGTGGNVVVEGLGNVVYNPPPGATVDRNAPLSGEAAWQPTAYRPPHRNLQGYERELGHFFTAVRAGVAPTPDIADARATLRLVERMDELL